MAQRIFKTRYVEKLKSLIIADNSFDRYLKGRTDHPDSDTWIKRDLKDIAASGLELKDPELPGKTNDFENAVMIFEEWKNITPTQATDHRLWAYLCHVPFMDFLRKRRPIEKQEELKLKQYVLDHWFVDNPGPSAFKTNDIYLFWWGPHVTYDKEREDPYELTRELFSMLDYTRHLLPGYQGRNRDFTHAVLEFVIENPELFSRHKEAKVRFIMRKLNFVAGYRALATLSKQDIKELIARYRKEIAATIDPDVLRRAERKTPVSAGK